MFDLCQNGLFWSFNALLGFNLVFSVFYLLFFQSTLRGQFVGVSQIYHDILFLLNFDNILIERNVEKNFDLSYFFDVVGIFEQDFLDSVNNSVVIVLKDVGVDRIFSRVLLGRERKEAQRLTNGEFSDTPALVRSLVELRAFDGFKIINGVLSKGWMLSGEGIIVSVVCHGRCIGIVTRPEVESTERSLAQS